MTAKKRVKNDVEYTWYAVGDLPDNGYVSLGDAYDSLDGAIEAASDDEAYTSPVCVYRLVPVKIVRRAGVIVEDVS